MKFLIIRLSSIGDIVLTTPVIRCLKQQILTSEIHYVTKSAYSAILESNPYVDEVFTVKEDLNEVLDQLKEEDYDYVIDLHHNLRSLKIKRAIGKPSFSFPKLNIEKWLLTAFKINRMPDVHIVDRYLSTLEKFGIKNDGQGLDYFIPEQDHISLDTLPSFCNNGYTALVLGATFATKRLPLHKLQQICEGYKGPLLLLGGKEDAAVGAQLEAIAPERIYNACGKYNLNQSADMLRQSKKVVTHDTGLMHIAAAFQVPILSIWGNTIPELGMYPYYAKEDKSPTRLANPHPLFEIFEVHPLSCRPCSKIGHQACPRKHFKCMELQDVPGIIQWMNG